jgi:hypothetical protein
VGVGVFVGIGVSVGVGVTVDVGVNVAVAVELGATLAARVGSGSGAAGALHALLNTLSMKKNRMQALRP